ncbi:hypothetical protein CKAH01_14713 [Colletotrichum kahawae]|uniref:Uncharacterized protein n=1 Tax=Colletotrichum kahawae TaxID=34407 RepID=A0AAD9YK84_COLKA|nr:hypothetical protein CKAH01_14713 [Colletotrichum kahawae]
MKPDGRSSRTKNGETFTAVSSNRNREYTTSSKERIEFDEVYQDGKAEFKHTIVKFSDKFYILKYAYCDIKAWKPLLTDDRCDKHGVHFRQNALIAAAKHLNSALHGFLKKDFRQAIELLGIRVSNCTDALAKLNNDCVRHAFDMGYKPMNLLRSRYYASNHRSRHDTPTPSPERSMSLPAVSRQIPETERALEDVLNPTPGELYWANCPKANKASVAMALGWKALSMCGRNEMFCDLALHKEMPRPRCYEFDDEGIVGWAAGYRDGESLVSSREVPVMRCESNGEDSFMWTSVQLLTLFRLDDPDRRCDADAGELRTRQVYARARGFESFESMLAYKAIKEDPRQETSRTLPKTQRTGSDSESELQSTGSRSLRSCDLGKEVLGDDAVTEMRSAALTDPRDFDNVQDTMRSTVESTCPSLSHTPDIQKAESFRHQIRPKDSTATPTPLNTDRENQPGEVHTFETSSLLNSREETASHSPGASVASFLEQLRPRQNREEGTRTCTPHAEHHADTIEVLLSPPNRSSHQQPRLEADRQHTASTRARHRRQSQRTVVRQLRSRFMSTDSQTSAARRK